jgi:hypothetical protein
MLPDRGGLVHELAEARMHYVVIGGIVVAAHAYVRATEDVDIVQRLPGVPSYAELEASSWEAELGGAWPGIQHKRTLTNYRCCGCTVGVASPQTSAGTFSRL